MVGFQRRLVGQPLLYAVSIFASLGVFLVSRSYVSADTIQLTLPIPLQVWV
jgi:hypothetical protein